MAANTFGEIYRLTSFGESHGKAIGGIIDGCPPGIHLDVAFIQSELNRRRPGQSHLASPRQEADEIDFLSGLIDGKTTGTPIAFAIWNSDQRSGDYNHLKDVYRPSHADYTYEKKYGVRDHRGGGRSSARETIARVVAGAIAKTFLKEKGISIQAYVSAIGEIEMPENLNVPDSIAVESSLVRCPDKATSDLMQKLIEDFKEKGDTLGGVIKCHVNGLPPGLGSPVFDKFHADLGKAMLSINAVKGFDYGSGFMGVKMPGSTQNDRFITENGIVKTLSNHSGGIQGGITNGEAVYFRTAFKPVATIMQDQQTIDKTGNEALIKGKGRHDVCVVPRAVVIVEAMAALVTMDHFLRQKMYE
jgi:chorismate synthase